MMPLLLKARSMASHVLGLPAPIVAGQLLGRTVKVHNGTIRQAVDYDDAWLLACSRHAEVVFDIGANVGYDALLATMSPQLREIVLVEANPIALSLAAENLIRNGGCDKARFVSAFAGEDSDGTVRFWTTGAGVAGSMYLRHAKTAARRNHSIWAPCTTVDALCSQYDLVPDLVKIDVEGAEAKVLRGSGDCARRQKSRFLVEMHANPDLPMLENARQVLAWSRTHAYDVWYLKGKIRLDSPQPIQNRGRCHLLLQPRGWPFPVWLRDLEQSAPLKQCDAPVGDIR